MAGERCWGAEMRSRAIGQIATPSKAITERRPQRALRCARSITDRGDRR